MKTKVALGIAIAIASINVNATTTISDGQESISIMQSRFENAYKDQMNNHNADARFNNSYNDLKMAKGGASDISDAPAITTFPPAPTMAATATIASLVNAAITPPVALLVSVPQKAPKMPKVPFGKVKTESINQVSETAIAAPATLNNNNVPQPMAVPAMAQIAQVPVAKPQKNPGLIPTPKAQFEPVLPPQPVAQVAPMMMKAPVAVEQKTPGLIPTPVAQSVPEIKPAIAAPATLNNNYVPQPMAVPVMEQIAQVPVAKPQKNPGLIPTPVAQSVPEIKPAIAAPATLNNNNVPVAKTVIQASETAIAAPATLNNNNVPVAKPETREMLTAPKLQPTVQAALPTQRATSPDKTVVKTSPNAVTTHVDQMRAEGRHFNQAPAEVATDPTDTPVTVASYSAQIVANQAIETAEQNRQSLNNERAARVSSDKQTLAEANAHTDSKFSELKKYDQETRKHANAGTASALAASQIPQVYGDGKFMVGAGAGTYSDQQAVAVGMSFSVNNNVVVKSAVTADTQSNFGAGVGVGVQFN